MSAPVLAPIGSDSFNRTNENPLNSTNWAAINGLSALQILSDLCCGTAAGSESGDLFKTSAPNDQYVQATLAAANNGGFFFLHCRFTGGASFFGYELQLQPGSGGSGHVVINSVNGTPTQLASLSFPTVSQSDVWVLAVVGTTLYAVQNGTQALSVTDSTYSSGSTGLMIEPNNPLGTTGFTNFVMGSASVPPTITAQPASQTIAAGQTATFSVTATGTTLTYQWQKNGIAINGATSSSYTTPALTSSDDGAEFAVVVTSNAAANVTSIAAILTVNPGPDGIKVIILQQYDPDPKGVNPNDPDNTGTHVLGKIRLHDYTVGTTIILSANIALPLIAKGWAQAV